MENAIKYDKDNEQEIFTKVVNHTNKNDRVSWDRQYKKLQKIIEEQITPIEDKILELHMQKQPHVDTIMELRSKLVKECIHPRKFLSLKDDHVLCKFCDKKLGVND